VPAAGVVDHEVAALEVALGIEDGPVRVVLAPGKESGVVIPEADDGCRQPWLPGPAVSLVQSTGTWRPRAQR
jgi:hypothetical protein